MRKLQILMMLVMVGMSISVEQIFAVSKAAAQSRIQSAQSKNTGANYLPGGGTVETCTKIHGCVTRGECICGQRCSGQTVQECLAAGKYPKVSDMQANVAKVQ